MEVDDEEIIKIMNTHDLDNDGAISYHEFAAIFDMN
jgi:Ca2+-binding EF-hand superfamily protein